MAKAEIHGPLLGSPGPGPMYRLNPPLIGPVRFSSKLMKITNLLYLLFLFLLWRYTSFN
jgi:hypothetical protein